MSVLLQRCGSHPLRKGMPCFGWISNRLLVGPVLHALRFSVRKMTSPHRHSFPGRGTGLIQAPGRYAICVSRVIATSYRPTSSCLISTRSAATWHRPLATSSYIHSQAQTQTPASAGSSAVVINDGGEKEDKDSGREEEVQRNSPLSPYGGRFGVPEQPISTKSKALTQAGAKRSPFAKVKDCTKSKVNGWTDEMKIWRSGKGRNIFNGSCLLARLSVGIFFAEFSEFSRTGSKLWKGTRNVTQDEKALYMHNIIGTLLKTSEPVEFADLLCGKISAVIISRIRFGEQTETFMSLFLDKWSIPKDGNLKVEFVELNIQETSLKTGLVRMMVLFIRKYIPELRHNKYVLHYESISNLKGPPSIQNTYLGYVFPVDSNCKIRWGAHGNPTEAEHKTLLESVQCLSERRGC